MHLGQRVFFAVWVLLCAERYHKSANSRRSTKEAELKFHHQIVDYMEKYKIPPSLIINFDQTPSKYVQISSNTMERKGTKNVPISGRDNKRFITATFSIIMENRFLLMHLIYKGRTSQSLQMDSL